MPAQLEHVNYTVSDAKKTAGWLCDVFDWRVRWEGPSMNNGYSMHVGTEDRYVALYTPGQSRKTEEDNYVTAGGLNHVAVVVDDLDDTEERVKAKGFRVGDHYDYEPGKRFYFYDDDGIEYEVVSYP